MEKLVKVLNECGADEYDIADMIHAYLTEYGKAEDDKLIIAIYQGFFKKERS